MASVQINNKEMDAARKGDEVCIKIEPIPGESPKMFGRHFDETDVCVSKVFSIIFVLFERLFDIYCDCR